MDMREKDDWRMFSFNLLSDGKKYIYTLKRWRSDKISSINIDIKCILHTESRRLSQFTS